MTETRQVSGFTAIDLAGTGEVTVEQGETESLTIEADDNVLARLTSKVSDSTLKLDQKPGITIDTKEPIRYRVTVKDLTESRCRAPEAFKAREMTLQMLPVDISGSGTVDLSGSAVEQDIEVSGSGRYEAADLQSEKVTAEISGSGQIESRSAASSRSTSAAAGRSPTPAIRAFDQSSAAPGR